MKAWAVAMVAIVAACGLYVAWMAYDSVDKTTGAVMADQEAMTAPIPLDLLPGMILTGDDLLRRYGVEPSKPSPPWRRVPVRIIKNGAAEVEVAGRRYRQVVTTEGCRPCTAESKMALCDVVCPYCKDGHVFIQSGWL